MFAFKSQFSKGFLSVFYSILLVFFILFALYNSNHQKTYSQSFLPYYQTQLAQLDRSRLQEQIQTLEKDPVLSDKNKTIQLALPYRQLSIIAFAEDLNQADYNQARADYIQYKTFENTFTANGIGYSSEALKHMGYQFSYQDLVYLNQLDIFLISKVINPDNTLPFSKSDLVQHFLTQLAFFDKYSFVMPILLTITLAFSLHFFHLYKEHQSLATNLPLPLFTWTIRQTLKLSLAIWAHQLLFFTLYGLFYGFSVGYSAFSELPFFMNHQIVGVNPLLYLLIAFLHLYLGNLCLLVISITLQLYSGSSVLAFICSGLLLWSEVLCYFFKIKFLKHLTPISALFDIGPLLSGFKHTLFPNYSLLFSSQVFILLITINIGLIYLKTHLLSRRSYYGFI